MTEKQSDVQAATGATVKSVIPRSVGNDLQALEAVRSGVALCDRSSWGRIQITGSDRLTFLHNQSTNDFKRLHPGQGCDTVFITSTARTLDLASAYATEDAVMVLVSPQRRQFLLQWLDRYIFFGDQVVLTDLTDATCSFSLLGPDSSKLLQVLGMTEIPAAPNDHHQALCHGIKVRVAAGGGLASPGYTLIAAQEDTASLWQLLTGAGAIPLAETVWEQLRIEQGRPKPDHELTENYNPLEVGLWSMISFTKGCYIGQETIARLNTYQGVKQRLWGIRLKALAEIGTSLTVNSEKVGILTSAVQTPQGPLGLAYVRTKAGGPGLEVTVGNTKGELIAVPFVTHVPQSQPTEV